MNSKNKAANQDYLSVWERSEPEMRASPAPLNRRLIVNAAISIADADGLAAVSLRKVGAALNSSAMRLYGYIMTKSELLDLMVDRIYDEMMASGPFTGDWRDALSEIAFRLRRAALEHGWFIELVGMRPHQGPGALAFLEASHAALATSTSFTNIDHAMKATRAVYAYALGAIRIESGEIHAERESGKTKQQWLAEDSGYLLRMIAKNEFPTLARIVTEHTHPSITASFEDGLECLLDGIAVNLPEPDQSGQ